MQRSGTSHASNQPRTGVVLGGGGILGGMWLMGALYALEEASGFVPQQASHVVGTSAGSVLGSLTAEGIPPSWLVFHQRGGDVSAVTDRFHEPIRGAEEESRGLISWTGTIPRPVLGSPCLAVRTALQPWRFPPMTALTAWMGRGFLQTAEIGRLVRALVPSGWSSHPNLWLVALDYNTGRRVVFGQKGSPRAHLDEAVQASCAVPGLYRPMEIGGRTYIDGGVWSPSNVDLLAEEDLDMVIALNPMSSLQPGIPTTIVERAERRVRSMFGRRLGREAKRLTERGVELLLIQPESEDLDAMGINLMDPSRRLQVLETAISTTSRRLRQPDALEAIRRLKGIATKASEGPAAGASEGPAAGAGPASAAG